MKCKDRALCYRAREDEDNRSSKNTFLLHTISINRSFRKHFSGRCCPTYAGLAGQKREVWVGLGRRGLGSAVQSIIGGWTARRLWLEMKNRKIGKRNMNKTWLSWKSTWKSGRAVLFVRRNILKLPWLWTDITLTLIRNMMGCQQSHVVFPENIWTQEQHKYTTPVKTWNDWSTMKFQAVPRTSWQFSGDSNWQAVKISTKEMHCAGLK